MSNFDSSNKEVETNLDFTRSQNYSSSNSIEGTFSNSLGRSNSSYPYNSYNNSSYSANNPYSSGYGGYSGYGSNYGNSYGSYGNYGGYGSGYGYSSYGGSNQYSNTYSKPIPQNQVNEQMPPPTFKHDVWGFLNGFHAILNVLYAGTGIIHFGKMFVKMSIKIIKMVFGKAAGLFFKLTGFQFLKNIMQSFSKDINWQTEFSFQETPLENAWRTNPEGGITKTFFGKFMLVLRICSLMGALISFFLRKRLRIQNQTTPMQAEVVTQEDVQPNFENKVLKLEDITNMYEEVRLLDSMKRKKEHIFIDKNLKTTDEGTGIEIQIIESINEEQESEVSHNKSIDLEEGFEYKEDEKFEKMTDVSKKSIEEKEIIAQNNEETKLSNTQEKIVSIDPTFEDIKSLQNNFSKNLDQVHSCSQDNNTNTNTKEQVLSEDFWQNREELKNSQDKNAEKAEEAQKTFVVPSVLQTLRTKSSAPNKPWLMKKKTAPEIKIEEPQEQKTIESSVSHDMNFEISKETAENSEEILFGNNVENAQ